jgi:hypothetical protein
MIGRRATGAGIATKLTADLAEMVVHGEGVAEGTARREA